MKRRIIVSILTVATIGFFIYLTYPDNIFAIRKLLKLDSKEILQYQRYRIEESAKYKNYDTFLSATTDDFYENKK